MAAAAQAKPVSRVEPAVADSGIPLAAGAAVGSETAPAIDPIVDRTVDRVPDRTVVPHADAWLRLENLPCLLTIEIAVPGFTVADLVHLVRGRIIVTGWTVGQDVPLRINDELIAWSEFEIVQKRIAVRLTELA